MRRKLFLLAALAAIALASAQMMAGASVVENSPPFRVVYVSQIGVKAQGKAIKEKATKSTIAAVQLEIANDAALTRKLRARGIQIRNIIGRVDVPNGRTIFYVR